MSTTNLTTRELKFIRNATENNGDSGSVGECIEDFGYTAQECGGFISSLIQKGVCVEWNEPQAMKAYQAQFAFSEAAIDLAYA